MREADLRDGVYWVYGLARSGCAAGALLRRRGARVIGLDDASEDDKKIDTYDKKQQYCGVS